MDSPIKRKERQIWNHPGHSHYFTFSTFQSRPYLSDERICEQLAKRINEAAQNHCFAVLAYVFMPNHVHMLIHPKRDLYDVSAILKAIKHGPSLLAKNRGWIDTNLWEAGGGYDRNVVQQRTRINAIRYIHRNPVRANLASESADYRWSSANWYFNDEPGEVICHHVGELEFELE